MRFTRRGTLAAGLGTLAGASMLHGRPGHAEIPVKQVAAPKFAIEQGASLRVLRPTKFVAPDETYYNMNAKKFSDQTGVPVRVEYESWEDLRPKTAVAANVGSGPDVVAAWSDDPQQYADKVVDLSDVADYLGQKYGGWFPIAEKYGKATDGSKWVGVPLGASGNRVVYRKSWVNEAGYESIPPSLDGFLDLCRKLQKNNHPAGLALGNAVGDANSWCEWVLWAHGAAAVDENNQVILDSKQTVEALKYAKALYETFIPGTLAWLDTSNNKAFLAGLLGLTTNGISIYYAAKSSKDEGMQKLAEDIYHGDLPTGVLDRPAQRALIVNPMVFSYTKYPNAAKDFIRFMMERDQYEPYLNACIGYWGHPLRAYDEAEVWKNDPKHKAYQHVLADALWDGYRGSLGPASQSMLADFVIVQMVASVCAGQAEPEDAAAQAALRAKRYYRS